MIINNILITGGNGMIGNNMHFGIKPISKEMDICNYQSIKQYIINCENNIECIIHLAATNLRESEINVKKSIDTNINGTINMLNIAKELDIPFVYVSTGAVFSSFNVMEKFNENDKPIPNCIYGYTKLAGENITLMYNKGIVVRTGWLFGGNQKNHYKFVEHAINNLIMGKEIYCSNDFVGSPTFVEDFIDKLLYLLQKNIYGVFHIVNNGHASGYEIGLEISKNLNKDERLIIGDTCVNIPNSGPYRSNSEILKTNHDFLEMRHWRIALNEYVHKYVNIGLNNFNISIRPREKIYNIRENCRLCNSSDIVNIFTLEPTPPANHFLLNKKNQERIPLDVCICKNCNHIQLLEIINPSVLYDNYFYVSSTSKTMIDHLHNSINYFIEYLQLKKHDKILEIGANDGVCIKYLLDNGYENVVGIDPAKNIKNRNNLPIICDYFGSTILNELLDKYGKFKFIFGFHCCAHIENIQDVFNTVFNLLEDDGIFVMEVGYFYDVFKNKTFDTIYHEHIDYHTCFALKKYCDNNNLYLFDIKRTNIQGGSIQFFISKNQNMVQKSNNVGKMIIHEKEEGLFDINNLIKWFIDVNKIGECLNQILKSFKQNNKKIVGYGASAKSTTFMYQFGLSNHILDYIIDDNIYKLNHYSPGLHIPIKSIKHFENDNIDYILILSWNFTDDIIKKLKKYTNKYFKIIIPFPNIQII